MVAGSRVAIAFADACEAVVKEMGADADQIAYIRAQANVVIGDVSRMSSSMADRETLRGDVFALLAQVSTILQLRSIAMYVDEGVHHGDKS